MAEIHPDKSELAGHHVIVKNLGTDGGYATIVVEDWWDRVSGKSWMFSNGSPEATNYAIRSVRDKLPLDNDVLYGKHVGSDYSDLFHVSEVSDA